MRREQKQAPAFGADELLSLPAQNWITNGGNIYNQRYSTLGQINRDLLEAAEKISNWSESTVPP